MVAVTGGALSLIGAAAPTPAPVDASAAVEPVGRATSTPLDALLLTSIAPVTPEPELVDTGGLVKAVQLVEQETARLAAERAAAEERAAQAKAEADRKAVAPKSAPKSAPTGSADCGLDTAGLGAVKPHVRDAAEFLGCLFGRPTMFGVAARAGKSDHPAGLAVDFMVNPATGNGLADCALRNKKALGITYVIWAQRFNDGSGWQAMEDRGSVTANHLDHVHISFAPGAGAGDLAGC